MKIIKYSLFSSILLMTFFSPMAKADEVCSLEINGKNVNYTMCTSKKKYSKLKSVLMIQLNHALLIQSDFEAVIKKDISIYAPKDPHYQLNLKRSQWGNSKDVLERAKKFANNANLTFKWVDLEKGRDEGDLFLKKFPDWKNKFNTASKEMLQEFSKKDKIVFTQKQIAANTALRDILATDYWSEKGEWKTEWVKIPKGKNILGTNEKQPGHFKDEVEVTYENKNEFQMQVSPLTQKEWVSIMGENPSRFRKNVTCPESFQLFGEVQLCPDRPVENISASDVEDFIKILSLTYPHLKVRLPTSNEWEFAAKAQAKTLFWFGSNFDDVEKNCWSEKNAGQRTNPVKTKPLNPFGLSDMCGNVWQMTKDKKTYVLKSGSWTGGARILRAATKKDIPANERYSNVGFRLIKE